GGIMAILGELEKAGLLHTALPTVHSPTMADALDDWDIGRTQNNTVRNFFAAAPGGVPTQTAFSQSNRWPEL
ncbi:MAG TPA: dihydroxy-acid dehydratase, partial [Erythrobacter sp.]|nr:dihydroxy-acid dehydratase [Erythrobacter sp.]